MTLSKNSQPAVSRGPIWTARCKSGYQFHSSRTGKLSARACNNVASRGMLLCPACLSAEPVTLVPMAHRASLVSRLWSLLTNTPPRERITLEPVSAQ